VPGGLRRALRDVPSCAAPCDSSTVRASGARVFPRLIRTFPQRRRLGDRGITRCRLVDAAEANSVPRQIIQEGMQLYRITGIEDFATRAWSKTR